MKAEIELTQAEIEEAIRLYAIQRLTAEQGKVVIFKAPIEVTIYGGAYDNNEKPLTAVIQLETE